MKDIYYFTLRTAVQSLLEGSHDRLLSCYSENTLAVKAVFLNKLHALISDLRYVCGVLVVLCCQEVLQVDAEHMQLCDKPVEQSLQVVALALWLVFCHGDDTSRQVVQFKRVLLCPTADKRLL